MPSRIKILPDYLINQIAAGEVIEQPLSVVKELVENSIDACSRTISVEIKDSGKSLIRVFDDGIGMSSEDLEKALLRHATSKLSEAEDLFNIQSLGFRGEALPSIASVSKMTIFSRDKTSSAGTQIYLEGGKILERKTIGFPQGTQVMVTELFFNTPARRKFLRDKIGAIGDLLSGFALAWPEISFKFINNGRLIFNYSRTTSYLNRAEAIFSQDVRGNIFTLEDYFEDMKISGFLSLPQINRRSKKHIYLYINRRLVQDRLVFHAILRAYHGFLVEGNYPLVGIFLELDPRGVDVNVHPTKKEVRFFNPQRIHSFVEAIIKKRLREKVKVTPGPDFLAEDFKIGEQERFILEERVSFSEKKEGGWRILGQLKNSYIILETTAGLLFVDQHAAHEKIVYERLKEKFLNKRVPKQNLLVPQALELNFSEKEAILENLDFFSNLGFELEDFGAKTVLLKAVPAILSEGKLAGFLKEMISEIVEYRGDLAKAAEKLMALIACHGSIRANQRLNILEMENLLTEAAQIEIAHCPHGRPFKFVLTFDELEKIFKRK